MNNKFTIILFSALLLLGLIYWGLRKKEDSSKIIFEVNFDIENPEKIQEIQMVYPAGTILNIKRSAEFWTLNDSIRIQADQIELLLETIQKVEVKYVPPRAAVPNILDDLNRNGILVKIFAKGKDPIKSYILGGVTSDERGSYMMIEGDDYPYVTHIPQWEGSLRPRYYKPLNDWKDRYFTRWEVPHIDLIKVEYPLQQDLSFQLTQEGLNWQLMNYRNTSDLDGNDKVIRAYLQEFGKIGCEAYLDNPKIKLSHQNRVPHAIVEISGNGKLELLKVYSIQYEDGRIDQGRYHIIQNNQQLILVQRRILGKILKPYDYFLQK